MKYKLIALAFNTYIFLYLFFFNKEAMGSICVVQKTFDKTVLPLDEAIFFNYCLIIHIDKSGPLNVDGKHKETL